MLVHFSPFVFVHGCLVFEHRGACANFVIDATAYGQSATVLISVSAILAVTVGFGVVVTHFIPP